MEILVVGALALLVIAGSRTLAGRYGIPAPLVLVVVGIVVGLLPFTPDVEIDPEWILAGVLPPLLYSASVSMPATNFRREFGAIGGLSIVLVLLTSLALGLFFAWAIPGLGFAWGVALGAVISPTDAVATTIAKRVGVSPRVMAMLEGESLLNDASALVILRTAVASAAAAFSFGHAVGQFAFAVVVAVVIGAVVGRLNLIVRARTSDATVNTVLSFAVPFAASIPAELLGASGLVAAVTAGIITGRAAPRTLSPRHRLSDSENWRTIELVLEGAVFLLMGLELSAILSEVRGEAGAVGTALLLAAAAIAITLVVRLAYVAPLLRGQSRRAERTLRMQPRLTRMNDALQDPARARELRERLALAARGRVRRSGRRAFDLDQFGSRVRRMLADVDYLLKAPLTWRDGGVLVWAGMRGAVTVAAAQTLPEHTPHRSLLVLVAFAVATFSLLLQGGTLAWVVRLLKPTAVDPEAERAERAEVLALLAGVDVPADGLSPKQREIALVRAKRDVVLDARDAGTYDAEALASVLAALDAEQISLELQGDPDA